MQLKQFYSKIFSNTKPLRQPQIDPSNGESSRSSTITPGHSLTPSSSPLPARLLHDQQQSPVRHGVDLWAVTKEGDVLTRLGVTSSRPEGASWRHVATDQPFKCISVGEENCVWGVSADGAAWYRSKMTPATPQGEAWIHVGKPGKDGLYQLSAGSTVVWAVDSRYQLWLRKDVTPSTPGGTAWLFVSFNVKHVSCGFLNQVGLFAIWADCVSFFSSFCSCGPVFLPTFPSFLSHFSFSFSSFPHA